MVTVGTRVLKTHLSRYLKTVGMGEEVMVTVHGKPWARIVPESKGSDSIEGRIRELAAKGLLEPASMPHRRPSAPIKAKGKPLSEIILEDRE